MHWLSTPTVVYHGLHRGTGTPLLTSLGPISTVETRRPWSPQAPLRFPKPQMLCCKDEQEIGLTSSGDPLGIRFQVVTSGFRSNKQLPGYCSHSSKLGAQRLDSKKPPQPQQATKTYHHRPVSMRHLIIYLHIFPHTYTIIYYP